MPPSAPSPSDEHSAITAVCSSKSNASVIGTRRQSSRPVCRSSSKDGGGDECDNAVTSRGRRREHAAARPSGTMARASWHKSVAGSVCSCFSTARIIRGYDGACASPSVQKAQSDRAASEELKAWRLAAIRSQSVVRRRGSAQRREASATSVCGRGGVGEPVCGWWWRKWRWQWQWQ